MFPKTSKHDSGPALSLSRDGVPPIPSGNRVFGVDSCRKPQKHDSRPALSRVPPIPSNLKNTIPAPLCRRMGHRARPAVAGWGIGSRQFRAGIVFLEFLAAENLKNRPALSRDGASGPARIVFLEFLAAENLKNTIPAPLCRGMGHRVPPIPRESCFWSFLAAENLKNTIPRPALSRDGASGPAYSERESCFWTRKPQKHDSRLGHRVPPIPSGNRVFGVFSCRKPQKHDSRPTLSRDGASGPANSEQESCFWSF